MREKNRPSSHHSSVLYFFNSFSGSNVLPLIMFNIGNDNPHDPPTVKEDVPPP